MQLMRKKSRSFYEQDESIGLATYQQIKDRLLEILQTFKHEKESWEKQQIDRTLLLRKDLAHSQLKNTQLEAQNANLKQELQAAKRQLQEAAAKMEDLKKQNHILESSRVIANNIIAYLQAKNKQLQYQLFQVVGLLGMDGRNENKIKVPNSDFPKYLLGKLGYPASYDNSKVDYERKSLYQLQKTLIVSQFLSNRSSSCEKKTIQCNKSNEQSNRKLGRPKSSQILEREDNAQTKRSLKKGNRLDKMFELAPNKMEKVTRTRKRSSLQQDQQLNRRQKLGNKSKCATKRAK